MNNINEIYINVNKRIKKSIHIASILSIIYYVFLSLSFAITLFYILLSSNNKILKLIVQVIMYICYATTLIFSISSVIFERKRRIKVIESIALFNHIFITDGEILYSLAKKHSLNFNNIINDLDVNDLVNLDKEYTSYILKTLNENTDKKVFLKFENFKSIEKLNDLIKNHPKICQGYQLEGNTLIFYINKSYIPIIEIIDSIEFENLTVSTNLEQLKIVIDYHAKEKALTIDSKLID